MEWIGTLCAIVGAGTLSVSVMHLLDRLEGAKKGRSGGNRKRPGVVDNA